MGRSPRADRRHPQWLLAAFARIRDDFPGARLIIAGPDEGVRANLQQFVQTHGLESRVQFPGTVSGEEKTKTLQSADVFALTSHSEGLPNAVIEGLGHGLAMLLTHRCNVPEVTEYQAGHVVDAAVDPIEMGLRALLEDAEHRQQCQQNARRLAVERFELTKVVDDLEQLYRGLTGSRTVSPMLAERQATESLGSLRG
ncbi:glycosyltransferase [Bremerella sp. JC770]|uniref:glycosyltransferase n=1 Tax=Bremerella sp. JC770 TaxID=3232137 RepID=UPI00345B0D94